MEHKLQLCVFMLLIQVSLALWQRMTVKKGQTVDLSCPITNPHKTDVEWKSPEGFVLFFNRAKGESLTDKRFSFKTLSEREFTISISDVTFKDGGNYMCSLYGSHITVKILELTVLSDPKMTRTKNGDRFDIKCVAEANHYPPQIFWKFDHGPEFIAHPQVVHEDKKYISKGMIGVRSVENRVTVKCIVRHPALHSHTLIDFVKIGKDTSKPRRRTTSSSPTAHTAGSTEVTRMTSGVDGPSSESSVTVPSPKEPQTVTEPTGFPQSPHTLSTDSRLSTTDNWRTSVSSDSTRTGNDTISNVTSTTGWISVSETTEIQSSNHTEGNTTGTFNEPDMRTGTEGSSSLLVFLVTFLIICLLVVVIFFAIKLRRAHIAWKRENEDSDPSEESSKSKSSQEERNAQGQRRRGFTAFTQYVNEETPVITSVTNTAAVAATEYVNTEQTSQPQTPGQTPAKGAIKETEL
ncbi:cytotoxic and regulatory T-cell molecule [Symphorus nematophorus]